MDASRFAVVHRLLSTRYPADGPGACLLVVRDDRPVFLAGFGLADVRENVPVTPATIFDLASLSKHVTTFALFLLASRGKLSLDDEVRKYVPELDAYETGGRELVLNDLACHKSGLAEYTDEVDPALYPTFTNQQLVAWLPDQLYSFAPGSDGFFLAADDPTYCNSNYALLATVVERASGVVFPEFLRHEVFDPLGMKDTFCDPWQADHPGQAKRYDSTGSLIREPRVIPVYGDGNLYTTMADWVRWDAELGNPTLMPREWHDRIHLPGSLDDGRTTDYAWGWYIRAWPGRRVVWHAGGWDGTSTCYSRWLDDRVRLALFSNTQQQAACDLISEIEEILLD